MYKTGYIIVDLLCNPVIRVICVYRSFRPPGMLSPDLFFSNQLAVLKNAVNDNCFIMGDFNLDASMSDRLDYIYNALDEQKQLKRIDKYSGLLTRSIYLTAKI